MRILLDPLSSLLGGGGSSSSATTSNQQVGAEGNSGPVFGAITLKGNSAKSNASNSRGGGKGRGRKGASASATASAVPMTAGTATASPQAAPASSGSGNLNISVVSGDSVAEQDNANISSTSISSANQLATASIGAQNALATNSIIAQNNLAGAVVGLAQDVSHQAFQFAGQSQQLASDNANNVLQSGNNFAGLYDGGNPNGIISPVSTPPAQNTTNVLLLIGAVIAGIALFEA